jgi:pimeloyl-ACP methyl ester carboxylesterase
MTFSTESRAAEGRSILLERILLMSKGNKKIIYRVVIGVAIFCFASTILIGIAFSVVFDRNDSNPFGIALTYNDISGYDRSTVHFDSGENKLTGFIYGENNDKGLIVISHGIASNADSYLAEIMYFVDKGWRVFAYDGTGTAESEGNGICGLPQALRDLRATLDFIDSGSLENLPLLLYGHSMGGYAVTAILGDGYDISGVVSVAGFSDPNETMDMYLERALGFIAIPEIPFVRLWQYVRFGEDATATSVNGINHTDTPALIINGENDDVIPADTIALIAKQDLITNPNVQWLLVDDPAKSHHDDMHLSRAAASYFKEHYDRLNALHEQYGEEIPESVFDEFYRGIDKDRMNEIDSEFMETVDTFYGDCVKRNVTKIEERNGSSL